jgi:hypothetical protein
LNALNDLSLLEEDLEEIFTLVLLVPESHTKLLDGDLVLDTKKVFITIWRYLIQLKQLAFSFNLLVLVILVKAIPIFQDNLGNLLE